MIADHRLLVKLSVLHDIVTKCDGFEYLGLAGESDAGKAKVLKGNKLRLQLVEWYGACLASLRTKLVRPSAYKSWGKS